MKLTAYFDMGYLIRRINKTTCSQNLFSAFSDDVQNTGGKTRTTWKIKRRNTAS